MAKSLKARRDEGQALVPPAPPLPKRREGRPTRCTPELTTEIAANIKSIGYLAIAAELVGVHRKLAYEWQQKGLAGEAEYVEFADAVQHARAEWVKGTIQQVEDPKWLLERSDPTLFGPKAETPTVNVTVTPLTREEALAEIRRRAELDHEIRHALGSGEGPR
jgi:hypothetical protein